MTQKSTGGGTFLTPGRVIAGVLALIVLALAVANFGEVPINFLLFTLTLPIFFVIVGALVVGYMVGWLSRKPKK